MTLEIISGAVLSGALLAGARWPWWRLRVPGLPVLAYRNVGDPPEASRLKSSWVRADKFRAQLAWLAGSGHSALLFSDLAGALRNGGNLPERSVLLIFDGAYEDIYTRAFPALREFGIKANIFAAYGWIGKADLWKDAREEPWVNMASLDMLKEMRDSALVEFGSSAMTCRPLVSLPPEDAAWEISESKRQLEAALERRIIAFSYPSGAGALSPDIRKKVFEAGYELDFGPEQGKTAFPRNREDGALKRLTVGRGDGIQDLKLRLTRGASRLI